MATTSRRTARPSSPTVIRIAAVRAEGPGRVARLTLWRGGSPATAVGGGSTSRQVSASQERSRPSSPRATSGPGRRVGRTGRRPATGAGGAARGRLRRADQSARLMRAARSIPSASASFASSRLRQPHQAPADLALFAEGPPVVQGELGLPFDGVAPRQPRRGVGGGLRGGLALGAPPMPEDQGEGLDGGQDQGRGQRRHRGLWRRPTSRRARRPRPVGRGPARPRREAPQVVGQRRGRGVALCAGPCAGTSGRSSPGRAARPAAAAAAAPAPAPAPGRASRARVAALNGGRPVSSS